jgi:hypothetical protein
LGNEVSVNVYLSDSFSGFSFVKVMGLFKMLVLMKFLLNCFENGFLIIPIVVLFFACHAWKLFNNKKISVEMGLIMASDT